LGQLTVAAMRTDADLECAFSMPNTGPVRNVSYSKQIKVGWSSGFGRGLLREEGSSTVRRARARPAFDPQLALSLDYLLLDYPLDIGLRLHLGLDLQQVRLPASHLDRTT
jgi:hypothetical protein